MSRNIKEIGKELMGKSLNSFHRKTGLTQLEKNNEMQDGILDGILSQVDDAYIEKTEQSNVIHLDGSGDGVVVLDSIEGNTMVNLFDNSVGWKVYSTNEVQGANINCPQDEMKKKLKPNTQYTYVVLGANSNISLTNAYLGNGFVQSGGINVTRPALVTTKSTYTVNSDVHPHLYHVNGSGLTENDTKDIKVLFIEGDHTDKSLNYFEGLQSSFEEKVNDEGKYEIEILSSNSFNFIDEFIKYSGFTHDDDYIYVEGNKPFSFELNLNNNSPYVFCLDGELSKGDNFGSFTFIYSDKSEHGFYANNLPTRKQLKSGNITGIRWSNPFNIIGKIKKSSFDICKKTTDDIDNITPKRNKIKLLLNEPLREVGEFKDKLYVKDNKLMVERNCGEVIYDGSDDEKWTVDSQYGFNGDTSVCTGFAIKPYNIGKENGAYGGYWTELFTDRKLLCNLLPYTNVYGQKIRGINAGWSNSIFVKWDSFITLSEFKNILKDSPLKIVYPYYTPIYEEVLNEYGEPILLEGYENGTIYIDSTIVPTTTVKYTPKMESFKTLKEVNNNNIMLTNDVNDNIIPYMMDVDLMIMEKEMALMSQYKIRRIGAKDMTSMQKRTQDMLTRLIKGKTLTEQECKTRVVTYLDAGKITDAQADELMLLISEVYA